MPTPITSNFLQPKTIGIVGSRRRGTANDFVLLCAAFDLIYKPGDRIVSGGCPKGADEFAEVIARKRGLTIIIHHADWRGPLGQRAGFRRNTEIARDGDEFLALVAPDRKGGTEDTVAKCLRLGKTVWLVENADSLIFQGVRV